MKMGKIYIISNSKNAKIYIGQTRDNIKKRFKQHCWSANRGSDTYFHNAMRIIGIENFYISLLEICNISKLNSKEKFWIKQLKSNIKEFGYNLTSGGDSCFKVSLEVSAKISKNHKESGRYIGEKNPFFGKTHTPEVKKILSDKNKGKKVAKETIAKIKKSQQESTKFKERYSPVKQYTRAGIFITLHDSIHHAAKSVFGSPPNIYLSCNGTLKFAYGFVWRFEEDDFNKFDTRSIKKHDKIVQLSLVGNLIKIFDRMTEAEHETGINHTNIINCCKGRYKHSGGFIWKYYSDYIK